MNISLVTSLFVTFALMSLIAIGGANALLPELQRQIVDVHGWMTAEAFINTYTVAQVAPGPNVLIISLIGWKVGGFWGMVAATLGITVPPALMTFAVGRTLAAFAQHPIVKILREALVPMAIGLVIASGLIMARTADHHWLLVLISLGSAALIALTPKNPLYALSVGAVLAIAATRLGLM